MRTLADLLERKYEPEPMSGCWLWTGAVNGRYGYIAVKVGGQIKQKKAHRVTYEAFRGPIPAGTEIDHLCRNRFCVNPYHLEAVPHRVNVLRGESPMAKNAAKTHCPRGHEYTEDNVYRRGPDNRHRYCRTCHNAKCLRRYYARVAR